jgi:hypothetical protein
MATFNSDSLNLEEFRLETLRYDENGNFLNPRIVMIAPSGSGKSWVVKNVLHTLRDIPCGTVIAPTDKMTKFYDDFVSPLFINHDYKPNIIPKILMRQKNIIKKNKERETIEKKAIDPRTFLVMDDCMATAKEWSKDQCIAEIMMQGRHYQLTYILTMQYCLGISPDLRTQFNFVFLLGDDNAENRKKLWKHWAGVFPSLDAFEQVFAQVTQDYGCMVINNRIKSMDLSKKVFWFRAKPTPDFRLGTQQLLKFSEENYDENHENRNTSAFNNNLLYGNRKKTNIRVKLI